MKYIIGGRRSGVTSDLIMEASRSGAVIVTATHQMKRIYEQRAKELEVDPPEVYCYDELAKCSQGNHPPFERIVIDNFDIVLRQILRQKFGLDVKVDAIGTTLENDAD